MNSNTTESQNNKSFEIDNLSTIEIISLINNEDSNISNLIKEIIPNISSLIDKVISSKSRDDLIHSIKALDRILLWGNYVIPQWHISAYRTLYWDIFDKPKIKPKYSLGTNTWWINSNKANTIDQRKKTIQ